MSIKTTLDLSYLEAASFGDADTMKELLELLQTKLKDDLPKVRKLYTAQKWTALDRLCHELKNTLIFSGDDAMFQANLALWDITKQEDSRNGEAYVKILETRGKVLLQEVNKILKQL